MEFEKHIAERQALAVFLVLLIVGISLLLSIQRSPDTGAISINAMSIFWGILIAIFVYFILTFIGREHLFLRSRFCVSCGRSIPFDAVICPYCRHDYEKNHDR